MNMGLFGKKKERFVDWTEKLQKQQAQVDAMRSESTENYGSSEPSTNSETSASPFPFFAGVGASTDSSSSSNSYVDSSAGSSVEERKRRLTKRLMDMTAKIEDLSNQVYQLQQRIELLERKGESDY